MRAGVYWGEVSRGAATPQYVKDWLRYLDPLPPWVRGQLEVDEGAQVCSQLIHEGSAGRDHVRVEGAALLLGGDLGGPRAGEGERGGDIGG